MLHYNYYSSLLSLRNKLDSREPACIIKEYELPARDQLELEWRIQHIQHLEGLKVLSGGIANDLNNLLMTIAGNADLISAKNAEEDELKDRLKRIKTAVEKASDLTFQMLSYIGKGDMVVESLNLKRVITETEKMMCLSPEKRAILEFDLKDVPAMNADVSQIIRLVMNMITNASEVTCAENGTIGISLSSWRMEKKELQKLYEREDCPVGEYIFLRVYDRGCFLDRDTLNNMFGPFFHTEHSGRGLGMATTLELIRNQCGAIVVKWEENGERSVTACFPSSSTVKGSSFLPASVRNESIGSKTVLVVDDDSSVLSTAGEMLEIMGHTPLLAADGCEAVELLRNSIREIDCVMLDLNMPDLNGRQTFSILRRLRADLPVILSSGYIRAEATEEYKAIGINGFLQKPYDLSGLQNALEDIYTDPEDNR